MSDDVTVTALEPGLFKVEIREGSTSTAHRVRIPPGLGRDLGLEGVRDEDVVRASISFLLEREPATSILPEFGLDIIGRYFPEYRAELPRRFEGRA